MLFQISTSNHNIAGFVFDEGENDLEGGGMECINKAPTKPEALADNAIGNEAPTMLSAIWRFNGG